MRIVVVTIQRGRHAHLLRQQEALRASTCAPAASVVVSMDRGTTRTAGAEVVHLPVQDGAPLPLAAARNLGLTWAAEVHGAELVVFLDVDCLPSPALVGAYADAARRAPDALLSGPVWYLPPGVPSSGPLPSADELAFCEPHAARPAPAPGELVPEPRVELFWSLSFAVRPEVHAQIGGFDEAYVGYGGEDTDYALRAHRAGVRLQWVGGADAYHQHHPVSNPPVEHVEAIVRNARLFRDRWGRWPMEGWLAAFAKRGLVLWDPAGSELRLVGSGARLRAGASAPVD